MRTIYIDEERKCHTSNDGTMSSVEIDDFDGKCDVFIEGHCCTVDVNSTIIWPWRQHKQLAAAQAQYEADIAEAAAAYQEGVNSAYDL